MSLISCAHTVGKPVIGPEEAAVAASVPTPLRIVRRETQGFKLRAWLSFRLFSSFLSLVMSNLNPRVRHLVPSPKNEEFQREATDDVANTPSSVLIRTLTSTWQRDKI